MPDPEKNTIKIGCRWDTDDPAACFEADACGCFMDPCDYFGVAEKDCAPYDEHAWCCTEVLTCCSIQG